LGPVESLLGTKQVRSDSAGVAEVGPGAALQIADRLSSIVDLIQVFRELEGEGGQLLGCSRVQDAFLAAVFEKLFQDAPGMEAVVIAD
jgi:hypothetical protein